MLEESVLFINHGGQNSIVDGLLHGVPQIVVPGKVFERRYNAASIADNQCGITLPYQDFRADQLRTAVLPVINSSKIADNAAALGRKLSAGGGVQAIIDRIGEQSRRNE